MSISRSCTNSTYPVSCKATSGTSDGSAIRAHGLAAASAPVTVMTLNSNGDYIAMSATDAESIYLVINN